MRPETYPAGPRRGGGQGLRSPRTEGGLLKLPRWKSFLVWVTASPLAMLSAGCAGTNHLADYDFTAHGLAAVTVAPRRPALYLGAVDARSGTPLAPAINRSGAARQIAAGRARARLDSAASRLGVSNLMNGQLLERASRGLGARPVQDRDRADYVLLLHVRQLDIDAREPGQAWLDCRGTVSLLDRTTEREIWRAKVTVRDPLTASDRQDGQRPGAPLTAGVLYRLSGEEFGGVLDDVAALTAQAVVDRLRSGLREARRERSSPGE